MTNGTLAFSLEMSRLVSEADEIITHLERRRVGHPFKTDAIAGWLAQLSGLSTERIVGIPKLTNSFPIFAHHPRLA